MKTYTEVDTFRRLSRKPIEEAYEDIFKQIMLTRIKTTSDLEKACAEAGYTLDEYYEYGNKNL